MEKSQDPSSNDKGGHGLHSDPGLSSVTSQGAQIEKPQQRKGFDGTAAKFSIWSDSLKIEDIIDHEDWTQLSASIFMYEEDTICCGKDVYGALLIEDSKVKEKLAVKLLKRTSECTKEVDKLMKLEKHSNIVTFVDFGICGERSRQMYIAMELCCENLWEFVKQNPIPFDLIKSVSLFHQCLSAVVFIHSQNIVHRDIKPHNFLISFDGNVKLTDFGISKYVPEGQSSVTVTTPGAGSKGFKSLEAQEDNPKIGPKADIFSLGVTEYFILSHGHHPFGKNEIVQCYNILQKDAPNLSAMPSFPNTVTVKHLHDLFTQMLSHDRTERPTALKVQDKIQGIFAIDSMQQTGEKSQADESNGSRELIACPSNVIAFSPNPSNESEDKDAQLQGSPNFVLDVSDFEAEMKPGRSSKEALSSPQTEAISSLIRGNRGNVNLTIIGSTIVMGQSTVTNHETGDQIPHTHVTEGSKEEENIGNKFEVKNNSLQNTPSILEPVVDADDSTPPLTVNTETILEPGNVDCSAPAPGNADKNTGKLASDAVGYSRDVRRQEEIHKPVQRYGNEQEPMSTTPNDQSDSQNGEAATQQMGRRHHSETRTRHGRNTTRAELPGKRACSILAHDYTNCSQEVVRICNQLFYKDLMVFYSLMWTEDSEEGKSCCEQYKIKGYQMAMNMPICFEASPGDTLCVRCCVPNKKDYKIPYGKVNASVRNLMKCPEERQFRVDSKTGDEISSEFIDVNYFVYLKSDSADERRIVPVRVSRTKESGKDCTLKLSESHLLVHIVKSIEHLHHAINDLQKRMGGNESTACGSIEESSDESIGKFLSQEGPSEHQGNTESDAAEPLGESGSEVQNNDSNAARSSNLIPGGRWLKKDKLVIFFDQKLVNRSSCCVYHGEQFHSSGSTEVAVKMIRDINLGWEELNMQRKLSEISHDYITKFIDGGEYIGDGSYVYIVTELHPRNLKQFVNDSKFLPDMSSFQSIFHQLLEGLQFIHSQKIIHRDIKPENILVTADGRFIYSDFGISKEIPNARDNVTLSNTRAGCDAFRAPELYDENSKITTAVDIFSIALVAICIVSKGEHAFGPDSRYWTSNIQTNHPPDLSVVPLFDEAYSNKRKSLINLLESMLQHQPEVRPTVEKILDNNFFKDLCNCPAKVKKKKRSFGDAAANVEGHIRKVRLKSQLLYDKDRNKSMEIWIWFSKMKSKESSKQRAKMAQNKREWWKSSEHYLEAESKLNDQEGITFNCSTSRDNMQREIGNGEFKFESFMRKNPFIFSFDLKNEEKRLDKLKICFHIIHNSCGKPLIEFSHEVDRKEN